MTISPDPKEVQPTAPGYGDQGPAGAGRDVDQNDMATETADEPEPAANPDGRA
jgi:hypothetical protein